MGECTCSKIAIMQLFHELKQQFPTLSDHIVAECIAQEGHNKETCARSLRETQERRPSPGAFPPPGPNQEQLRGVTMNQEQVAIILPATQTQPNRPGTLDIGSNRRLINCTRVPPINYTQIDANSGAYQEVFANATEPSGFEVNVNVACKPVKNTEPHSNYCEPYIVNLPTEQNRSFTSVSLTLRPPSSEPQAPIDIRSQRSSLTYSTSSSNPRGFQSRVQISIGPGNVGTVAAARIRPPMGPTRPSSLLPSGQYSSVRRTAGLPTGPPSQLSRPTMTMSAPTTPLVGPSGVNLHSSATSLPTTPIGSQSNESMASTSNDDRLIATNQDLSLISENQRQLIAEQLERKNRLAREVEAEKGRLESMKKEIELLLRPFDSTMSPEAYKQQLQREIFQLQVECNKMANEIDQNSEPGVAVNESNEEFYRGIYTGQPFGPRPVLIPPPLPTEPPAWQVPINRAGNHHHHHHPEERDGPSWVCRMCTFKNHPLMKRCEQCDLLRIIPPSNLTSGETQDIHIRVTHHHNFSPRTVHSWVV
ncbi:TGF-beta-activated kinase 1 and MAP3K7-binding protein 2 isoform X2 [Leptopilina boulardi]|uniref:TGF-beta-activated kinase 1 and MAP3K7-binding protein 2 isoform X2 n=1 Tax=Leptopilina boulardi TaxID=63433 RepID=UPI0021F54ECE|nr:TGF-beta-activated kinase 1 and MAP3K7-binding protein 2 isoform X2 [Leptopilina boulardi]